MPYSSKDSRSVGEVRYGIRSEKLTEFDLIPFQKPFSAEQPATGNPGTM